MYTVLAAAAAFVGAILLVNVLQERRPSLLPPILRSWNFLPLFLRSLEPLDTLIQRIACCSLCPSSSPAGDCCGEQREGGGGGAEEKCRAVEKESLVAVAVVQGENGNLEDHPVRAQGGANGRSCSASKDVSELP